MSATAAPPPRLQPGEPAPPFHGRTDRNPRYAFDTVAGRYVILAFLGSGAHPPSAQAWAALRAAQAKGLLDDRHAAAFAVTADRDDDPPRMEEVLPGLRVFRDTDLAISRLYGAAPSEGPPGRYVPHLLLLDPQLRVLRATGPEGVNDLLAMLAGLPPPERHAGVETPAPVLLLPRVLEPDFCDALIRLYDHSGGEESGFMRAVDGRTVPMLDPQHKRRRDHQIAEEPVREALRARLARRLVPEIHRAFQFHATRVERYIVACYDAADGGHFRAHRDNTTPGTAHRRFAVSINLNEEFEGGDLWFPEFGPRRYRPPRGGAVVFSCSLLHEATRVTRGRRYATLPFLYDEAAARIRDANRHSLAGAEP